MAWASCRLREVDGGGGVDEVPPDAANVITEPDERPAVYRRASLVPLYEITPITELSRFEIFGETMQTADFTTASVGPLAEILGVGRNPVV